jgi:hypothetical protein
MNSVANLDHPPTVTSIEALDYRHQENIGGQKRGRSTEDVSKLNKRDFNTNNLAKIIERSISATSSLIGRSQQSRSRSKREAPGGTGVY